MKKVITYGTYDLLHHGHIRLLERAKSLGDYLIVGVTSDDFDKSRGKINVQQSLMERIEGVKQTGLADEIIIEEYNGQKIDDIRRYDIDIFTVGSDWIGKFDYLNEFCEVIYLERTNGISSSEIRSETQELRIGLCGESNIINKFAHECTLVNGVSISGICAQDTSFIDSSILNNLYITNDYNKLLEESDAVYIISNPEKHAEHIRFALNMDKHVICESPISLNTKDFANLSQLAKEKNLVLMDGIKTAYSLAYNRMILLIKSGIIGDIVSVDSTCTSLNKYISDGDLKSPYVWNSMCFWGPTALLPIFDILGYNPIDTQIISKVNNDDKSFDYFSKISFIYPHASASAKIGQAAKSEGELIISGTKGYIYVPAPWWKTEYFEVRFENPIDNKRYFYQLAGEGIQYEILSFVHQINKKKNRNMINENVSNAIINVIENFYKGKYIEI